MSKKNRYEKEETQGSVSTEDQALEIDQDSPEAEPVLEEPAQSLWSLADAASHMILDYKMSWFPSIYKFAQTHCCPELATESELRDLFLLWGAKLK